MNMHYNHWIYYNNENLSGPSVYIGDLGQERPGGITGRNLWVIDEGKIEKKARPENEERRTENKKRKKSKLTAQKRKRDGYEPRGVDEEEEAWLFQKIMMSTIWKTNFLSYFWPRRSGQSDFRCPGGCSIRNFLVQYQAIGVIGVQEMWLHPRAY